jgi:hypothetical protein
MDRPVGQSGSLAAPPLGAEFVRPQALATSGRPVVPPSDDWAVEAKRLADAQPSPLPSVLADFVSEPRPIGSTFTVVPVVRLFPVYDPYRDQRLMTLDPVVATGVASIDKLRLRGLSRVFTSPGGHSFLDFAVAYSHEVQHTYLCALSVGAGEHAPRRPWSTDAVDAIKKLRAEGKLPKNHPDAEWVDLTTLPDRRHHQAALSRAYALALGLRTDREAMAARGTMDPISPSFGTLEHPGRSFWCVVCCGVEYPAYFCRGAPDDRDPTKLRPCSFAMCRHCGKRALKNAPSVTRADLTRGGDVVLVEHHHHMLAALNKHHGLRPPLTTYSQRPTLYILFCLCESSYVWDLPTIAHAQGVSIEGLGKYVYRFRISHPRFIAHACHRLFHTFDIQNMVYTQAVLYLIAHNDPVTKKSTGEPFVDHIEDIDSCQLDICVADDFQLTSRSRSQVKFASGVANAEVDKETRGLKGMPIGACTEAELSARLQREWSDHPEETGFDFYAAEPPPPMSDFANAENVAEIQARITWRPPLGLPTEPAIQPLPPNVPAEGLFHPREGGVRGGAAVASPPQRVDSEVDDESPVAAAAAPSGAGDLLSAKVRLRASAVDVRAPVSSGGAPRAPIVIASGTPVVLALGMANVDASYIATSRAQSDLVNSPVRDAYRLKVLVDQVLPGHTVISWNNHHESSSCVGGLHYQGDFSSQRSVASFQSEFHLSSPVEYVLLEYARMPGAYGECWRTFWKETLPKMIRLHLFGVNSRLFVLNLFDVDDIPLLKGLTEALPISTGKPRLRLTPCVAPCNPLYAATVLASRVSAYSSAFPPDAALMPSEGSAAGVPYPGIGTQFICITLHLADVPLLSSFLPEEKTISDGDVEMADAPAPASSSAALATSPAVLRSPTHDDAAVAQELALTLNPPSSKRSRAPTQHFAAVQAAEAVGRTRSRAGKKTESRTDPSKKASADAGLSPIAGPPPSATPAAAAAASSSSSADRVFLGKHGEFFVQRMKQKQRFSRVDLMEAVPIYRSSDGAPAATRLLVWTGKKYIYRYYPPDVQVLQLDCPASPDKHACYGRLMPRETCDWSDISSALRPVLRKIRRYLPDSNHVTLNVISCDTRPDDMKTFFQECGMDEEDLLGWGISALRPVEFKAAALIHAEAWKNYSNYHQRLTNATDLDDFGKSPSGAPLYRLDFPTCLEYAIGASPAEHFKFQVFSRRRMNEESYKQARTATGALPLQSDIRYVDIVPRNRYQAAAHTTATISQNKAVLSHQLSELTSVDRTAMIAGAPNLPATEVQRSSPVAPPIAPPRSSLSAILARARQRRIPVTVSELKKMQTDIQRSPGSHQWWFADNKKNPRDLSHLLDVLLGKVRAAGDSELEEYLSVVLTDAVRQAIQPLTVLGDWSGFGSFAALSATLSPAGPAAVPSSSTPAAAAAAAAAAAIARLSKIPTPVFPKTCARISQPVGPASSVPPAPAVISTVTVPSLMPDAEDDAFVEVAEQVEARYQSGALSRSSVMPPLEPLQPPYGPHSSSVGLHHPTAAAAAAAGPGVAFNPLGYPPPAAALAAGAAYAAFHPQLYPGQQYLPLVYAPPAAPSYPGVPPPHLQSLPQPRASNPHETLSMLSQSGPFVPTPMMQQLTSRPRSPQTRHQLDPHDLRSTVPPGEAARAERPPGGYRSQQLGSQKRAATDAAHSAKRHQQSHPGHPVAHSDLYDESDISSYSSSQPVQRLSPPPTQNPLMSPTKPPRHGVKVSGSGRFFPPGPVITPAPQGVKPMYEPRAVSPKPGQSASATSTSKSTAAGPSTSTTTTTATSTSSRPTKATTSSSHSTSTSSSVSTSSSRAGENAPLPPKGPAAPGAGSGQSKQT